MRRLAVVVLGLVVAFAKADQTIVVDGQDASIKYTTTNNGDTGATWTVVQRSPDSCDTPQMLTSRLGDYVTYTFTGTGLQVVGTIGVKRGDILFTFDGVNTTFDRSNPHLVCDSVLFQKSGLPDQQHTIVATLVGRAPNFSSGVMDGVLSIQRIRYFIPSGNTSNVGAIAGGAVAGALAVLLLAGMFWCFVRRRKRRIRRGVPGGYIDDDDHPTPTGKSERTTPGIVATPFVWNGPGSQYTYTEDHRGSPGTNIPPTPSTTAVDHNNVSFPSPNGQHQHPPSSYFPPMPLSAGALSSSGPHSSGQRTSSLTSSSGERKREAGPSPQQRAAAHFALSNPGSLELASPLTSSPHSPAADDILVDRIAHRLADIMSSRTGGVGVLDQIVPPPLYSRDHAANQQPVMEMTERSPQLGGSPSELPYAGPSYPSQGPPGIPPKPFPRTGPY